MVERPIIPRQCFKQTESFRERLLIIARESTRRAEATAPGKKREALLRAAELTAQLDDWLQSLGSPPPK
jgi:hypothetical protein